MKKNKSILAKRALLLTAVLVSAFLSAAEDKTGKDDTALLDDYVNSKGAGIISFDAKNIKQFWIDKSIISRDNNIEVLLKAGKNGEFESVPLKIQLANVNETMDCKVEVITNNPDISFKVGNNSSKIISTSVSEDDFIQYHVISSVFHMEDTQNDSFNLQFSSKTPDTLLIKKIVLSFSAYQESSYLSSPGTITVSEDNWIVANTNSNVQLNEDKALVVNGETILNKKILISDKALTFSVKIKNNGENQNRVYIGFKPYTKDRTLLRKKHYPYNTENPIMKVISSKKDSNSIIVDSYPKWEKRCFLAVNAKEDFSDIPNISLTAEAISEVKEIEDGKAEIILDKPLKDGFEAGTALRVHGYQGGYLYTNTAILQPGKEIEFVTTIQKDDNCLDLFGKAFPKGTYYVVPVITSGEWVISDFSISF